MQGQNRVSEQWLEIDCKAITVHNTLYLHLVQGIEFLGFDLFHGNEKPTK
jgi:hypothetical protein